MGRKRKKSRKFQKLFTFHRKDQVDQDEVDVHQDGRRLRPALQDPGPDPLPLEPHGTGPSLEQSPKAFQTSSGDSGQTWPIGHHLLPWAILSMTLLRRSTPDFRGSSQVSSTTRLKKSVDGSPSKSRLEET